MIKRNRFYGISSEKFGNHFINDNDCFKYLSEIKWEDSTFVCTRCGNTHFCNGHLPFSRRCTRCKHDESPTAGTVFDKIKFSLHTAFQIVFDLCIAEREITSVALSNKYGLRQKTVWSFRRKIQHVLGNNVVMPLTGKILVGDFKVGDSNCSPKGDLVIVGMELLDDKTVGRAYAHVIDSVSPESVQDFFKLHISSNSQIILGKESIYEQYVNKDSFQKWVTTELEYSTLTDNHISDIRKWLYGVHRHCSTEYIQDYLNGYYFRFNGRKDKSALFDNLINLIVKNKPLR